MSIARVVIVLAVALGLLAGAFHYAVRTGYNQCQAETQKQQKEAVIVEAKKYARIRNAGDAISELRQRAAAKRKAELQREP